MSKENKILICWFYHQDAVETAPRDTMCDNTEPNSNDESSEQVQV